MTDTNHTGPNRALGLRTALVSLVAALGAAVVAAALLFGVQSSATANSGTHIYAKALADHECDSSEWHFVITQVKSEADAPTSIRVVWSNGAWEDVPLWKYTGKTAHYVTTSNLGFTVNWAEADIYDGWHGQFNLSHGPCGYTSSPPTPYPSS